jgi:hypothetical protein
MPDYPGVISCGRERGRWRGQRRVGNVTAVVLGIDLPLLSGLLLDYGGVIRIIARSVGPVGMLVPPDVIEGIGVRRAVGGMGLKGNSFPPLLHPPEMSGEGDEAVL